MKARLSALAAKCSACGICLEACPVFALTGLETDGPRGRLLLARAILQERLAPCAALAAFCRCLLCGRCDRACPAGIPLTSIFFALRPRLALPADHAWLFRMLAANPQVQDFLQPLASLMRDAIAKTRTGKNLPALPLQPFSEAMPDGEQWQTDAVLFAGCITRRFLPHLAEACMTALRSHEVGALAPGSLVCCGRPLAMQGKSMAGAIKRNLAVLSAIEFRTLATPCPGCLDTITRLWPQEKGLTKGEKQLAAKIAAKSRDINAVLAPLARNSKSPEPGGERVWWHKPCLMADGAPALALIQRSGALVEQGSEPDCCGAPLACLHTPPKISKKLAPLERVSRKVEQPLRLTLPQQIFAQAAAAGANRIVTACPGCMLALMRKGVGNNTPVAHSVEIYAKSRA